MLNEQATLSQYKQQLNISPYRRFLTAKILGRFQGHAFFNKGNK